MAGQMDFIYSEQLTRHLFSRGRFYNNNISVAFAKPPMDVMAGIWQYSAQNENTFIYTEEIRHSLALYVYFASGLMGSVADPFKIPKEEKVVHRLFLENIPYLDVPIRTEVNNFARIGDFFTMEFHKNSGIHREKYMEFAGERLNQMQTFWGNVPCVHFPKQAGYQSDYNVVGGKIAPQAIYSNFQKLNLVKPHFANKVFPSLDDSMLMSEYGYNKRHQDHSTFYYQDMFNLWVLSILHYQASAFMMDAYELMR